MPSIKNLTVRGKTDGFGCQLNAKLSGFAYCFNHRWYRYIYTPFRTMEHDWDSPEDLKQTNQFIGFSDNRKGRRIHVAYKYMQVVFNNPNRFYNPATLDQIRSRYWSTPKPDKSETEIVVHIRRGDLMMGNKKFIRRDRNRRFVSNEWYNVAIPALAAKYPDHYRIAIHSEGEIEDFLSIFYEWPRDLLDRVMLKVSKPLVRDQEYSLLRAFHDMATAPVFLGCKSGLSYTASIYNEGDIYFLGSSAQGQQHKLNHWTDARSLAPDTPIRTRKW